MGDLCSPIFLKNQENVQVFNDCLIFSLRLADIIEKFTVILRCFIGIALVILFILAIFRTMFSYKRRLYEFLAKAVHVRSAGKRA